MILFLTVEYGMGTAEAANIIFLWSAATNFFPLVGAFIADSYTGRFPLIGFGSSISLLRDERGTMLSAMWLLPYMILGGISEALNTIAQNEFLYSELPKSMSSVATTLSGLGMSAASLISSWIITIVDVATYGSWITENIDEGHLDYYYWLLVGLSVLNVLYFVPNLMVNVRYNEKCEKKFVINFLNKSYNTHKT
ncbi:PREDICTED: protein NRT1/ PTR FAMILY 1.3-like isoform X3 [Camelina sativa]|nr:PREDICTED: protein NRT1/ PTR FAMILY 1.3-like isoform X3 [Camelina sativa]